MRSGIPIALTMLIALPASAEGWKNMYLAEGGSHLIRVEPSESQQVDAYVTQSSGDTVNGAGGGLILGVSCERIRLANGDPFMGSEVEVMATFDDDKADVPLGRLGYAGGAYLATYDAALMTAFRSHSSVTITVPSHDLNLVFSLNGFAEAFDRIECFKR